MTPEQTALMVDGQRWRDAVAIGLIKPLPPAAELFPFPTKAELILVAQDVATGACEFIASGGQKSDELEKSLAAKRTLEAGLTLVFDQLKRLAAK